MSVRLLLLLSLVLAAAPAVALDVQLEVGLGGIVPSGGWTPIKVRCELGPEDPPLKARVVFDRPTFAVSAYSAPLELRPGQATVVRMTVPVGLGSDYRVRVDRDDGFTLAEVGPSKPWRSLEARERLALLVGRRGLSALTGKVKSRPRLARLEPSELPWETRSLEYVAGIFISGGSAPGLSELCNDTRAVQVLREYVEGGGRLIFLARPGVPPPWLGTPLEALVPVRAPRLRSVPTGELAGLVGELSAGQISVLEGTLLPGGRWRYRGGSVGLVAERPLGEGLTLHVGFDVDGDPARKGDKLGAALSDMAPSRARSQQRVHERVMEDLGFEVFQGRRALGTLAFACLTLAVLVHLLVLGPLPGLLKRRGPWVAMLLPPLASLGIGVIILIAAALSRGSGEARALAFVFHDPEETQGGRTHLELGLFAGEDTEFDIALPISFEPTLQERSALDLLAFRSPGPSLEFEEGIPIRLRPVVVPAGGFSLLRLDGPPLAGPKVRVEEGDPPLIRIRSLESERSLSGLIAIRVGPTAGPSRLEALPVLGPGAVLAWDPGRAPGTTPGLEIAGDVFADGESRNALLNRIAERLSAEYLRAPAAGTGKGRAFPDVWIVQVLEAALPVTVHEGESPLEASRIHALEVHLVSAVEAP